MAIESTNPTPAMPTGGDMFNQTPFSSVSENYAGSEFEGKAQSMAVPLTDQLERLPDVKCKYVMLSNHNVSGATAQNYESLSAENLYENAGLEIYYGFGNAIAHQLFPTQTSPLIPVCNLNQIVARVRIAGADTVLYVTYFT